MQFLPELDIDSHSAGSRNQIPLNWGVFELSARVMPEGCQIRNGISSLEQGRKPWTQPVLESMDGGSGQVWFDGMTLRTARHRRRMRCDFRAFPARRPGRVCAGKLSGTGNCNQYDQSSWPGTVPQQFA